MKKRAATACPASRLVRFLAICLVLASVRLGADDFGFHEVGARAAALGGAFTAKADDITALFYNPAGLAFLGGFRVKTNLGFADRTTSAGWPDAGPSYRTSPHELLGNHALAWQPIKRVTFGLGLFSPYAFDSLWPITWNSGNEISISASLNARYFRSAVSVELFKGLAVSAGLDVVSLSVRWDHIIPFDLETYPLPHKPRVFSRHELGGHGLGFAAGALWKLFPALQIGARFHQSVNIDLAGENTFRFNSAYLYYDTVPDPYAEFRYVAMLLQIFYVPQHVTGRMTLPGELAVGAVLTPFSNLSLSLDVQRTKWSQFGSWEFRSVNADGVLSPEFTPVHEEFYGISPDYGIQSVPLIMRDARKYKAGLEYRLGRWLTLRAGFARHESTIDAAGLTPLYPDLSRNVYSLGAGYEGPLFSIWDEEKSVSKLSFDFFVRYATAAETGSTLPGLELTYASTRLSAGVGIGFIF
jgi:long-chain fatty acid transport protein